MIKRTKLSKWGSDMPEWFLMQQGTDVKNWYAESTIPKISEWTLIVAIQAVESELRKLRASSQDEMEAEDYECLSDYELAAEELEEAYAQAAKSLINLPPYSQLIQG